MVAAGASVSATPRRYRTIVADPPWPYSEGFVSLGTNHTIRGRKRTPQERGPIQKKPLPYPSMSLAEIEALPLPALADDSCRLFLWATMRYLPNAMDLLGAWGFTYKQTIVWDKTPNFSPLGGSVAPNAAEFLIVATRGNPERKGRWTTSVVRARKARTTHSRKPETFQDIIEQVSPGPYLELFARRPRLGWDVWGNEVDSDIEVLGQPGTAA